MKFPPIASTLLLSLAACSNTGTLDPGSGNDPGTGTATLTVNGTVSAQAQLTNARNPGEFDTTFSVRIQLAGQDVTDGNVTMTSSTGTVVLTYTPNNNQRWRGTAAGYDEVYVLDIDRGTDNVHDVRVDGPVIHTFTEPTAGATVDSTMPLMIKWGGGHGADTAALSSDNLDALSIPDTGSYSLSGGSLRSQRDQSRQDDLRLTRTNRVTPAGAAGGSELAVSIENDISVVAMPNPLAGN